MDAGTAALLGAGIGACATGLFAALTAHNERKARAQEWQRNALHQAAAGFLASVAKLVGTSTLASAEIVEGKPADRSIWFTVEAFAELQQASALVMPIAPDNIRGTVKDIELAATILVGKLRQGQPVGIGTTTEAEWRSLGKLQGTLASQVRKVLAPEPATGADAR